MKEEEQEEAGDTAPYSGVTRERGSINAQQQSEVWSAHRPSTVLIV